mgnify:FL=1
MEKEDRLLPEVGSFVRISDQSVVHLGLHDVQDKIWELFKSDIPGLCWIRRPIRGGKKFKKKKIAIRHLKLVSPLEAMAAQVSWPKKVFY